jgi:hypothetical protein
MYHRIISGELQQLALLCQKTGRPLSAAIEERITKSIKFSAAMLREDGSTPLLSDSATGDTNLRFDFARPTASDLTYWVQHSPQARAVSVLPGQPELRVFPDTGYAFARCAGPQDFHLTFDFGAFSRCIAPNHGHADALSFELHAHGSPLIIDPGTCFPANNDPHWTRYFRSTAAHNTLVIDGKEQSQFSHYTDLRRAAATQLLHYGVSGNRLTMTAQCIPYWVNGSGVRHVRRIDFIPDRPIQIVDAVSGSGIHQLEWFFHFAPKLEVCEQSSHTVWVCTADTHISMLSLRAENLPFLNLSLKRGENNPICGWVSSNSAQVQPAYVAVFAARVNLPISITFELDLAA